MNNAVLEAYREIYYKEPVDNLSVFIRLRPYLPNYDNIFSNVFSTVIQINVRAYEASDTDMRTDFERDSYGDDKNI